MTNDDCGCWKHDSSDDECYLEKLESQVKELELKIVKAADILQRMRSASESDFPEMPYWSNEVLKELGKE